MSIKNLKTVNHVLNAMLANQTPHDVYVGKDTTVADAIRAIQVLQVQLQEAVDRQIAYFYGDEIPSFRQGEPSHELEEYLTADMVKGFVDKIKLLEAQIYQLKNELFWFTPLADV